MTRRAFITGWPVSHSKSPMLHGYWLNEFGISGIYEAAPVESEKFKDFIASLPASGFVGGNVTIPHKEQAFELIANRSAAAEEIGAVNTIWIEGDIIYADNTDSYGFMANLDQQSPGWRKHKKATVLGAGGASRAVIHGLLSAGFTEIRIANRTISRASALSDRFGKATSAHGLDAVPELLGDSDVLVNTTSIGMSGNQEGSLPPLDAMPAHSLVTDIVYTPLITPLLASARERGLETVDGLGMLLHQAVPGFEKWFGKRPEVTQGLRNHILEAS